MQYLVFGSGYYFLNEEVLLDQSAIAFNFTLPTLLYVCICREPRKSWVRLMNYCKRLVKWDDTQAQKRLC